MNDARKSILLINPNRIKPVVAPIALDYLHDAITLQGHTAEILDLAFADGWKSEIDQYFQSSPDIDAIGITIRNMDDCFLPTAEFFIPLIKEIVAYIRQKSEAPIILGGTGYSIMPARILDFCGADFGFRGDGEEALPLLLACLNRPEHYKRVPGLVYRRDGEVIVNEPVPADLSRLSPDRTAVDNRRYLLEGGMGNIETKRGCMKKCVYCADPLCKGKAVRLRPPIHVVAEVESLLEKGVDCFHTCDSEFNLPAEHALEVCREMVGRGLGEKIGWYAYCSPAPFSRELGTMMKKAGCRGINFGVDSGSITMLRVLGRDFGIGDLEDTGRICRELGITYMYDLLLGGPGETRKTIHDTLDLMKKIGPDRVGLALGVRVYAGTPLAERIHREGAVRDNPNLQGSREHNEDFFEPVFYISSAIGAEIHEYVSDSIKGDKRFFLPSVDGGAQNYNYNDNSVLVQAIREGYRGAFWDILRRIG